MTASQKSLQKLGHSAHANPSSGFFHTLCTILCLVTVIPTGVFFFYRWSVSGAISPHYVEKLGVAVIVGVLIGGWAWGTFKEPARTAVLSMQLLFAGFIAAFCLLEAIGSYAPKLLPDARVQYREELRGSVGAAPDFLEHLPENPWVKLKPNTAVRSVGFSGDDFTSSWQTDALGYKNLPELATKEHVTAVAVGDSFVEGMGATIPDVWTTRLTQRGLVTYNLAVQGYATQQMVGTLKRYGARFHPEYVLIGYTPGFESRALVYEHGKPRRGYTGGIDSMDQYVSERRKMAERYKVTNAFFNRVSDAYQIAQVHVHGWWSDVRTDHFVERYREEVQRRMTKQFDRDSKAWSLAKSALFEMNMLARGMGATPVVVLFAQRGFVFYETVMGESAPDTHYEIQLRQALKAFCAEHDIAVIDMADPLRAYLQALPATAPVSDLPYWALDGHLSRAGNRIVAETVERYLVGQGVCGHRTHGMPSPVLPAACEFAAKQSL